MRAVFFFQNIVSEDFMIQNQMNLEYHQHGVSSCVFHLYDPNDNAKYRWDWPLGRGLLALTL